jgi:hypothetical protein
VFVVVAEQFEVPGMEGGPLTLLGIAALEACDPFEDQFGDGGVLTDHDEDGWNFDTGALPAIKLTLIVAVEGIQRCLQRVGQVEGAELGGTRGSLG